MKPRELVQAWVEAFNRADVDVFRSFYGSDATNHQVAESPVVGRAAFQPAVVVFIQRARTSATLT